MGGCARAVRSLLWGSDRVGQACREVRRRAYATGLASLGLRRVLARLEREADAFPHDAERQLVLLKGLNQEGSVSSAEKVVRRFESGQFAADGQAEVEYVKALVRTGRLESRAEEHGGLASLLSEQHAAAAAAAAAGTEAYAADAGRSMASRTGRYALGPEYTPPSSADIAGGSAPGSGLSRSAAAGALPSTGARRAAAGTAGGSADEPLVVSLAEPTFRAQLWKTVRTLGTVFLLMSGLGALMEERGLSRGIGLQQEVQPEEGSKNTKRFDDVKGCDEAKDELVEIVEYLKAPQKFTRLGGKLPKGVLLVGPPGTGKTLLARAIAGEAGVPFFYASGSEFEEMFVGVGARRVRDLFNAAKKRAPCIVFIDEIDAIGGKRNPKDQQYMKMTLNQLLVELDGFSSTEGIIVIGATNFPESLDKALIRPGRFDRHVVVPNPDVRGREQILTLHTERLPLSEDVDLEVLARGTPGFSGADLANLVNMAALKAAREGSSLVTMENFEFAKDKILMGAERKSAVISEENRRLTAYHEGGHALVAMYTDGAMPVHKATIVPRGAALGMVSQLPEKDMVMMSRRQMLAKLDVCMGGRAAEELIFGAANVTSGAESDFQSATQVADAMVTRFGMSERVGYMVLDGQRVGGDTRRTVEEEVKNLLDVSYTRAKEILVKHEPELHRLAAALLERETLTQEDIRRVMNGEKITSKNSKPQEIGLDSVSEVDPLRAGEGMAARARGAVAAAAAKAAAPRPSKVPAPVKTS